MKVRIENGNLVARIPWVRDPERRLHITSLAALLIGFRFGEGAGSSSPYVVSELTLVATVSFHHPPLLDEQETEAVLCQLWTINLVLKSSTDPRSTHDKAHVRQLSELGLSPQWIMLMGRGKLSVNKKKSSLNLKKFFKK
ncbi:hypothetical protein K7X08_020053 [Anisodus acutangulus]|uniref:Uncharacterized protein n=1 Tax=Anisodus acutangulus TaxID=402998 RepID=A0A9Q1M5P0_9SOLA|nr:hypothetical protein K7X08_020053 [Anisodus acutangulus]